jgi:hypothetical protein
VSFSRCEAVGRCFLTITACRYGFYPQKWGSTGHEAVSGVRSRSALRPVRRRRARRGIRRSSAPTLCRRGALRQTCRWSRSSRTLSPRRVRGWSWLPDSSSPKTQHVWFSVADSWRLDRAQSRNCDCQVVLRWFRRWFLPGRDSNRMLGRCLARSSRDSPDPDCPQSARRRGRATR